MDKKNVFQPSKAQFFQPYPTINQYVNNRETNRLNPEITKIVLFRGEKLRHICTVNELIYNPMKRKKGIKGHP